MSSSLSLAAARAAAASCRAGVARATALSRPACRSSLAAAKLTPHQHPRLLRVASAQQPLLLMHKHRRVRRLSQGVQATSAQLAQVEEAPASASSSSSSSSSALMVASEPAWEVKMLYDGDCPLCMREVDMLRRRDAPHGRIAFVDISTADYDPAQNAGIDFETAMGKGITVTLRFVCAQIHAIKRDGTVITNVEVFRSLYELVGLGWVYAITKNKVVGDFAESVYSLWAKYRMQVTGKVVELSLS
eukprot:jgi/Chlat1/3997/Chrsp26S03987